jgi:hypothetical protein
MIGVDRIPPSVTIGPSSGALLLTWRKLLAVAQELDRTGQAARARLRTLEALEPSADQRRGAKGPSFLPEPQGLPGLADAEADFERFRRDLGKHLAALAELDAGRATAAPAADKPWDLDIVPKGSGLVSGLGVIPILALVVVGALVIGTGLWTAVRTMEHRERLKLAELVEQGKDISKLVEVAHGSTATTARSVASITTPIAIAAGVVGLAMLAREWKKA